MRIVHVLTRLLRAGSEENTLLTSAGQIERGHEVIIVHGRDAMPEHAERLAPGARLVSVPSLVRELNPRLDIAAYRDLRRAFTELKPDVVHTHQSKAGIVGRFAAAAAGVPLVVHGVHILPFLGVGAAQRNVYLISEKAAARMTSAFIHVSEGMRQACVENRVGDSVPHFVVPSGFSLRRFAEAERPDDWGDLVGSLRQGEDRSFVVAMLAAFEPRKRHLDLLENLQASLKRFPQLRLVLAGEGHLRPEIEAAIARLGIGHQVSLAGFRQDPERIIAMADACIHCSEREGLPRSVLQYLASGRPVVTFHLPGIEEILTDGLNGWVVPQGDWSVFRNRLDSLITDPARRDELAAGARQTPLQRWDTSYMATRTLEIYDELARSASRKVAA